MSDKRENEDFEVRFEREIDFSNAKPNPYVARAKRAARPVPLPEKERNSEESADDALTRTGKQGR